MTFDLFNVIVSSDIDGKTVLDSSQYTTREDQAIIFAKWKLTNREKAVKEVTIIGYVEDRESDEVEYMDRLTKKTYLYSLQRYNGSIFVTSYRENEKWLEPQIKI